MAKIIILDYEKSIVRVISIDDHINDIEEIEEILTESYDYSLSNIDWMKVSEFKLEVD